MLLRSLFLSSINILSFVVLIHSAAALQCYRCVSSQPGCGSELSIRLERWHTCPDTGPYGGENFCVKVIETYGSDQVITRECLEILRHSTRHREMIPTVERQNYCEPARNNDPKNPINPNKVFCFCNDKDGCNTMSRIVPAFTSVILTTLLACWFTVKLR